LSTAAELTNLPLCGCLLRTYDDDDDDDDDVVVVVIQV